MRLFRLFPMVRFLSAGLQDLMELINYEDHMSRLGSEDPNSLSTARSRKTGSAYRKVSGGQRYLAVETKAVRSKRAYFFNLP